MQSQKGQRGCDHREMALGQAPGSKCWGPVVQTGRAVLWRRRRDQAFSGIVYTVRAIAISGNLAYYGD